MGRAEVVALALLFGAPGQEPATLDEVLSLLESRASGIRDLSYASESASDGIAFLDQGTTARARFVRGTGLRVSIRLPGTPKLFGGTFDYVYEKDGFRIFMTGGDEATSVLPHVATKGTYAANDAWNSPRDLPLRHIADDPLIQIAVDPRLFHRMVPSLMLAGRRGPCYVLAAKTMAVEVEAASGRVVRVTTRHEEGNAVYEGRAWRTVAGLELPTVIAGTFLSRTFARVLMDLRVNEGRTAVMSDAERADPAAAMEAEPADDYARVVSILRPTWERLQVRERAAVDAASIRSLLDKLPGSDGATLLAFRFARATGDVERERPLLASMEASPSLRLRAAAADRHLEFGRFDRVIAMKEAPELDRAIAQAAKGLPEGIQALALTGVDAWDAARRIASRLPEEARKLDLGTSLTGRMAAALMRPMEQAAIMALLSERDEVAIRVALSLVDETPEPWMAPALAKIGGPRAATLAALASGKGLEEALGACLRAPDDPFVPRCICRLAGGSADGDWQKKCAEALLSIAPDGRFVPVALIRDARTNPIAALALLHVGARAGVELFDLARRAHPVWLDWSSLPSLRMILDVEQARELVDHVLAAKEPSRAVDYAAFASRYLDRREVDAVLVAARKSWPRDAGVLRALRAEWSVQKRYSEAAALCDELVPPDLLSMAQLYRAAQDPARSRAALARIDIGFLDVRAAYDVGLVAEGAEAPALAVAAYRRCIEAGGRAEDRLARAYEKAGDDYEAVRWFNRAGDAVSRAAIMARHGDDWLVARLLEQPTAPLTDAESKRVAAALAIIDGDDVEERDDAYADLRAIGPRVVPSLKQRVWKNIELRKILAGWSEPK